MQAIINAIWNIPDYVLELSQTMLIPCIITLVVFLIVLLFSGKFIYILRSIYVVAGILGIAYAFFVKEYELIWIILASFILLIIVRLIISAVRTANENKEIARIEKEALAKADERRGSWENRKGYSGEERPIAAEEYNPETGLDDPDDDGPI